MKISINYINNFSFYQLPTPPPNFLNKSKLLKDQPNTILNGQTGKQIKKKEKRGKNLKKKGKIENKYMFGRDNFPRRFHLGF